MTLPEFVRVASTHDLADGEMRLVSAAGERVVLVRIGGEYYAIGWLCSHALGLLSQGQLDGYEVECPIHEGRFDVRTGQPTREPPEEPIPVYPVRVEGEDILVGPASYRTIP